MKKLISLVLGCAVLLGCGCACAARQAAEQDEAYDLYFAVRDLSSAGSGDAISTEASPVRKDDGRSTQELAATLMDQLLSGPSRENLKSPIPAGTALLSVTIDGSRAQVDLSSPYGTLSGVALTLADYCITLTLTQLPEIQTVSVTVRGQELAYRENQSFSAEDILLSSNEDVVGTVDVTLYFLDDSGRLTSENRTLELYEGDTQAGVLTRALEDGPKDKALHSALPEGFTIQSVWQEEDICYVNLPSSAIKEIAPGADLKTAIDVLARSLRSLNAVAEVKILVDGEFADTYGGVDIRQPFDGN